MSDPIFLTKEDAGAPVALYTFDLQPFQVLEIAMLIDQITNVQQPLRNVDTETALEFEYFSDTTALT